MVEHKLEKISTVGSDRNKTNRVLIEVFCSCGVVKCFQVPSVVTDKDMEEEKVYMTSLKMHEHFMDEAYKEVSTKN